MSQLRAHPDCTDQHVCGKPSERVCIEQECKEPAGTLWGPYWCPDHDQQRLNRVTQQFHALHTEELDRD